jgi:hypothetical protein
LETKKVDIDDAIGELWEVRKRLNGLREAEIILEEEILNFMQKEGATIRNNKKNGGMVCLVEESGVRYDPVILNKLLSEELVGPDDLDDGVYTPEHIESLTVKAKWDMSKGRKLKELGSRQREIIAEARNVGRHKVTVNKFEKVDKQEWLAATGRGRNGR